MDYPKGTLLSDSTPLSCPANNAVGWITSPRVAGGLASSLSIWKGTGQGPNPPFPVSGSFDSGLNLVDGSQTIFFWGGTYNPDLLLQFRRSKTAAHTRNQLSALIPLATKILEGPNLAILYWLSQPVEVNRETVFEIKIALSIDRPVHVSFHANGITCSFWLYLIVVFWYGLCFDEAVPRGLNDARPCILELSAHQVSNRSEARPVQRSGRFKLQPPLACIHTEPFWLLAVMRWRLDVVRTPQA